MSTYVLLSTLTSEGAQTLHANPDRMNEVNQEIERFGCKVVTQFATLGAYDFVTVVEAADNATIAHLSADLSSRGTVKITTLPAISIDRLAEKMKSPHKMGRSS